MSNLLQVSALEELLGFLSSLPAFSGLSRELLTSLAVFIRPLSAQPGQVLAVAGQPADALVIIQVGVASNCVPRPSVSSIMHDCGVQSFINMMVAGYWF
jgi:hypothetical protein